MASEKLYQNTLRTLLLNYHYLQTTLWNYNQPLSNFDLLSYCCCAIEKQALAAFTRTI